jgi:cobalt-zinc-cadmium efflux system protein
MMRRTSRSGGILAGSLSLIADALHNFSDAASLGIAFAARRIARLSDALMTFGYVRAEIVAALNYTTLIVIGPYLV